MQHLYQKGDYTWALFIGHLVIEKLLKAYYVQTVDTNPPFVHNLLRLADHAKLELYEDQKDFLATVTTFNIRARYDDYKLEFYHTCTKQFAAQWIEQIEDFRLWIKNKF